MVHLFSWYSIIPGLSGVPAYLFHTALVVVLLLVLALLATKRIRSGSAGIVPDRAVTLQGFFELVYEAIDGLMQDVIGPKGRKYMPLIGACALFIFTSNVLGLIPGFAPPTDNINVTAACGLTIFLSYHYFGLKEHGLKYFKHFMGPMPILAPLMVPIELISHLARPLSLSLRLMGNMTGDHLALAIFVGMVPLLIPIPIMALGLFVCLVQTLVFILLSMVYIAGAIAHDEH